MNNSLGLKNLQPEGQDNGWKEREHPFYSLRAEVGWGWFKDTCAALDHRKHGNHMQLVLLVYTC